MNSAARLSKSSPKRYTPQCWCGGGHGEAFSDRYLRCRDCGTLYVNEEIPGEHFAVSDEDQGFYGRQYWKTYLREVRQQPNLASRSRSDLPERNVYWLRILLEYQLSGRRALEVGCAHGSFVALLRQAGYDASGLDLSPSVLAYGRDTFGIPVVRGPIEERMLEARSFNVIAGMDVLEHFPDPLSTMKQYAGLLAPDGLFMIQTPCVPEWARSDADLARVNDPFGVNLKEKEHVYLFTRDSVTRFFHELGFDCLEFRDPLFQYDMFFVAARRPPRRRKFREIDGGLLSAKDGRMALALLDLDDRRLREYGFLQYQINELTAKLRDTVAESDHPEWVRRKRLEEEAQSERKLFARRKEAENLRRELRARQAEKENLEQQLRAQQAESQKLRHELSAQRVQTQGLRQTVSHEQKQLSILNDSLRSKTQENVAIRAQLETARDLASRLHRSVVYQLMRRLRLWSWVEEAMTLVTESFHWCPN